MFVLNLAFSDLVFTVTLPFWAVEHLHNWVFGDFVCKFLTAVYFVGLYSSIILLTAMTVDRFITVVLHNWLSKSVRRIRFAMGACVAAWVISIAASLSDAINVKEIILNGNISTCDASSDDDRLSYFIQVSLLFFLPFAIIIFCYSAILKTVLQATNRRRYRTVVVVLCIVAVFFICWAPYNMFLFVETFYKPKSCYAQKHAEIAYNICRILAFSHCCMNPLLYMVSQKLRKHLLHLLRYKNIRREQGPGISAVSAQNSFAIVLELQSK